MYFKKNVLHPHSFVYTYWEDMTELGHIYKVEIASKKAKKKNQPHSQMCYNQPLYHRVRNYPRQESTLRGHHCQQLYLLQESINSLFCSSTWFWDESPSKLLTVYNYHGILFLGISSSTSFFSFSFLFRVYNPPSTIFVAYDGQMLEYSTHTPGTIRALLTTILKNSPLTSPWNSGTKSASCLMTG